MYSKIIFTIFFQKKNVYRWWVNGPVPSLGTNRVSNHLRKAEYLGSITILSFGDWIPGLHLPPKLPHYVGKYKVGPLPVISKL